MIRLVAADMDGTLLNSRKQLSPGFLPLLDALLNRGVAFVVASGRQYFNLLKMFPGFEHRLWFICDNGSVIYHGQTLFQVSAIAPASLQAARKTIGALPSAEPIFCGAACAYMTPRPAADERDARNFYERCIVVPDPIETAALAADPICKIAVYDPVDAKGRIYTPLATAPLHLNVALSGVNWVDLMAPDVDKGSAIRAIQNTLKIAPGECAAFGDYENDLPLLAACTESYAMANGRPAVLAAARHRAPSNDEDGVSRTLQSLFPSIA
ncbi:MAG: Cof-type HAD-IIB family hydrolase [Kiritimatiellia bacterium]